MRNSGRLALLVGLGLILAVCGGCPLMERPNLLLGSVVSSQDSSPVEGVQITITDVNQSRTVAQTVTVENGRFEVKGMPEGIFRIWAKKDEFFSDDRTFSFPENRRIDFNLQPMCSIHGMIKKPDGSVADEAVVTLKNTTSQETVTTNAGPDGTYRVEEVKPGSYVVRANTRDGGFTVEIERQVAQGPNKLDIELLEAPEEVKSSDFGPSAVDVNVGGQPPKID